MNNWRKILSWREPAKFLRSEEDIEQIPILYHFTSYKNTINILKTNRLRAGYYNENLWISFTKDPDINISNLPENAKQVRLSFDTFLLREDYRILTGTNKHEPLEYTAETKVIPNIKQYLIDIQIIDENPFWSEDAFYLLELKKLLKK